MPIFEYQCKKCERLFEELVMNSTQEVCCPSCGSSDIEKLISAIAKSCRGCGSSACSSPGHT